MTTETIPTRQDHQKPKEMHRGGGSDTVYGLGLIGAWMYYFKGATTFKERAEAFFKGLIWPVFLVHDLFVFLKKE